MQWLLQVALSNVAVAAVLAVFVLAVGRVCRKPALLHCLWVLVLLKLVTPPVFELPLPVAWKMNGDQPAALVPVRDEAIETEDSVTGPAIATTSPHDDFAPIMPEADPLSANSLARPIELTLDTGQPIDGELELFDGEPAMTVDAERLASSERPSQFANAETATDSASAMGAVLLRNAVGVWLFGMVLTSVIAGYRIARFCRLLRRAIPAGDGLTAECQRLAGQLGLRRSPRVLLIAGPVSPMLWWIGFRAQILFPVELAAQLDRPAREALLMHELAHYRRGDHWIRLLEVVASCLYWWNPIVWLARRELHRAEEECCDAWVVSQLPDCRRTYATALVQAIDYLSDDAYGLAVPPLASGVAYFHDVKHRLTMIMTGSTPRSVSRLGKLAVAAVALGLLPLLPTLQGQQPSDSPATVPTDPPSKPSVAEQGDASGGVPTVAVPASTPQPSLATLEPTEFESRPNDLKGDDSEVRSISYSRDGKFLLVGHGRWTTTGLVRLWNLETGREIASVREPIGVASVEFSPDGKQVAWSTWNAVAKIADPSTLEVRHLLRTGGVARIAFSPDSTMLASASEQNRLAIWNTQTGEQIRSFNDTFRMQFVCFSPDGKTIAAGGGSFSQPMTGELATWDVESGQRLKTFTGHTAPVLGVAISPDGTRLASSGIDGTVRLWDVAAGNEVRTFAGHTATVELVQFSPDGQQLASTSYDATTRLWDVKGGAALAVLPHEATVIGLAYSPDGKTLASGGAGTVVRLWDTAIGQQRGVLTPDRASDEPSAVLAMAHSPDGRWIATSHEDNSIRLRDASGDVVAAIRKEHDDVVAALAFSPDSATLASASFDGTVKLWDCRRSQQDQNADLLGEPVATLSGHENWVMSVVFSPDGKLLATGSYDKSIRLWDVAARKELAVLASHTAAVRSVSFSPDGKLLAAGSSDRTTSVWNVAEQKQIATLKEHSAAVRAVEFSPDGTTLATAGEDKRIYLWDVETHIRNPQAEHLKPKTLDGHTAMVWCLAFSPRGGTLASGGFDHEIRLWDPKTGAARATLKGHTDVVTTLVFAPDASRLLSAGYDRSIKVWPSKGPPVPTTSPLATIVGEKDSLLTIATSPDGRWLAAAGKPAEVVLIDLQTGRVAKKLTDHQGASSHVAFSPDGRWLAAALYGGGFALWNLDSGKPATILKQHTGAVRRVVFSPDSRLLLSGGEDQTVKLWDVAQAKLLRSSDKQGHAISDVKFAPDGKTFVTSTGYWRESQKPGTIKLWESETLNEVGVIGQHEREIKGLVFSPSGDRLVAYGLGGPRIWDIETRTELDRLPIDATIISAVLLNDGRLATGDWKGGITIWDLDARQAVLRCEGHTDLIYGLSTSPDGSLLISLSRDGSIKLWPLIADRTRRPLDAGSLADHVRLWKSERLDDKSSE